MLQYVIQIYTMHTTKELKFQEAKEAKEPKETTQRMVTISSASAKRPERTFSTAPPRRSGLSIPNIQALMSLFLVGFMCMKVSKDIAIQLI